MNNLNNSNYIDDFNKPQYIDDQDMETQNNYTLNKLSKRSGKTKKSKKTSKNTSKNTSKKSKKSKNKTDKTDKTNKIKIMMAIDKMQKDVFKSFYKYKISEKKPSFNQICYPKQFTFQMPQLFVSDYMKTTNSKGLLLYHKIGAGKTCAAVQIALKFRQKKKIIMTCPASLVGNFYKELRSECTGSEYVSETERENLKKLEVGSNDYKKLIQEINERIDKDYQIYSYNKFASLLSNNKLKLDNSLLIIDEVQNIVSEHGSYYQIILNAIKKTTNNFKLIIMSATPIFDKPMELGLTLNLLEPDNFVTGKKFNETYINYQIKNDKPIYNIKNKTHLAKQMNGLISYYAGAPDYAFPQRIQRIIRCPMSKYQYDCYKIVQESEGKINKLDLLKLPNNFFIGSRIISNIAFPNKLIGKLGLNALTGKHMDMTNLSTYSIKYYEVLKRVLKTSGTVFIYSNFREYGGLLPMIQILEHYGYVNFLTNGPGKLRYAVWSGDETMEQKESIRETFNLKINQKGSKIKIILGSPAIKEGVSLLRLKQVHILEPYWNMSRLEQVIGRGIRFCSHKDVDINKRYVKVYIYLATVPTEIAEKEKTLVKFERTITIDEHIYQMALTKLKLSTQFEEVIKMVAIDKLLFQN
jgi:hypothetical protein